jgi:hypothetical protein
MAPYYSESIIFNFFLIPFLPTEEVQGIKYLYLIKSGKGFELFQTRVKTGFSRGLGTETCEALWEYVHSVQQDSETVGVYFERLRPLYGQVQLTKGCEFGIMSRKTLALKGLEDGAYHECLGPWVKKILAGQNKVKVETASLDEIQSLATNILVTSRFYKDHTILPGKLPARARAANVTLPPSPPTPPTSNSMMESVIDRIRKGEFLSGSQARWIRDTYTCIHCFSKTHGTESCHKLSNLYTVTNNPGGEIGSTARPTGIGPKPSTYVPVSGGTGRKATVESGTPAPPAPQTVAFAASVKAPSPAGGETSLSPPPVTTVADDEADSVADVSDDAFTLYDTLASSDADLVHSLAQVQSRENESAQPMTTANVPIPISARKAKTVATMGKADLTWLQNGNGGQRLQWDSDVQQALAY